MQQRYYDPIAGRFLSVDPIVTDANTGKGFGLYTYVDNNPYLKVDPDGKDAVILYGGGISSNPFGHIAIAVSGKGVFSPGTGTAPGSSTTAYVGKQAEYRNTGVIVLKTTPAQDAAIVKSMEAASERPMPTTKDGAAAMLNDNCATRVGDALQSAGVISPATVAGLTQFTGVHFPKDVLKAALADNPSASSSTVSKGQKPPEDLKRFDPPKKADEK